MTISVPTSGFREAKWIVSATPGYGTHTTIAGANAASASGDTILLRDGTYTEDVTILPGRNYTAWTSSDDASTCVVIGKWTMSSAGHSSISNIRLQTNSDFSLVVSGSGLCILDVTSCTFNVTNHTAISYTNSNASSFVYIYDCFHDISATGIALFAHSSAGTLEFDYTRGINSGGSSTANTASAGILNMYYSYFFNPITTSGTNSRNSTYCKVITDVLNVTPLTIGGASSCSDDLYDGGTASAVVINGVESLARCTITSSNANAINGTGTLTAGIVLFNGSSSTIAGTLTVNKFVTFGGTIV